MQYTIRRIPKEVDVALRRRARRARKTLNETAVEALSEGLELNVESSRRRSVRDLLGARSKDPQLERALAAQRRIDHPIWK